MSADLLLAALVIDERLEPDFGVARLAVAGLRAADVAEADFFEDCDPDDPAGMQLIRAQLRRDLGQLEAAIKSGADLSYFVVRGAGVYVTGGLSFGDAPTPLFDVIWRLRAVRGVLSAAGFEEERRAAPPG
jgi:hypothetical protein